MPDDGPKEVPVGSRNDDVLNDNLRIVFDPKLDVENPLFAWQACTCFVNLTGIYVREAYPQLIGQIAFDQMGLREIFSRFHRDAFGVRNLCELLESLEGECVLKREHRREIENQLRYVGIRINTRDPRKTKVAAAFTLWASALKPVYVKNIAVSGISTADLNTFGSSLVFWIACTYLSMFGEVHLPTDGDALVRLSRIRYDLTYRNLNLSSLEMLYASIFKLKEGSDESQGDLLDYAKKRNPAADQSPKAP